MGFVRVPDTLGRTGEGVNMKRPSQKRSVCPFPGCGGGCHVCTQVQKQKHERHLYDAACRLLRRCELDADTRLLAEHVREYTRPRFDERKGSWLP